MSLNVSIERKPETRERNPVFDFYHSSMGSLGPLRCQACSSVLTLRRLPSVVLFQFSLRLEKILSSSSSLIFHAPSESLSLPGGAIFSDSVCGFPLRSTFLANLLARSSEGYLWWLLLFELFSRTDNRLAEYCQPFYMQLGSRLPTRMLFQNLLQELIAISWALLEY